MKTLKRSADGIMELDKDGDFVTRIARFDSGVAATSCYSHRRRRLGRSPIRAECDSTSFIASCRRMSRSRPLGPRVRYLSVAGFPAVTEARVAGLWRRQVGEEIFGTIPSPCDQSVAYCPERGDREVAHRDPRVGSANNSSRKMR